MTNYLNYKKKIAVLDADDTDIESWITVKGNHIPIKKGQTKEEAVKSFIESKGGSGSNSQSTVSKRVEKSQKFESETGISPEDYEAYEQVRESGAYNMFDIGNVSRESGLSREMIKKIQEHYTEARQVYGEEEPSEPELTNTNDPRPKDADAETINDVLFEKYVPRKGKADTLLGEQLRAINKIVYRYENDGDMYGNGYGVETVNAPVKFLQSLYEEKSIPHLSGILSSLKNAAKFGDTTEYEYNIQRLKNLMVETDWKTLEKLANTKNDEDMYSFEDDTKYDSDDEDE